MLERVLKTISRYNMLPSGSRVIAAVSGGADSVCLLHVLVALAPAAKLHVEIAHYNHRWRGAESDGDEDFLRELARELNLPFHSARAPSPAGDLEQPPEADLEQKARRARLDFFRGLRTNGSAALIATGHTRDDQAETVLLRLLRGSGLAGLAGILPVTAAGVVRPLLDVTRAEVREYLRARNLAWREDSSNQNLKFARNRVRLELLPHLEAAWNPRLTGALAHLADLAHEEERWWSGPASPLEQIPLACSAGGVEVHAGSLAALPRAVARRAVRRAIARAKGDLRQIEFEHVERVLALAGKAAGEGRLRLPGIDVRRSFDWLRLAVPVRAPSLDPVPLTIPGSCPSPDGRSVLHLEFGEGLPNGEESRPVSADDAEDPRQEACATFRTVVLGLNQIPGQLELRGWRPGDRYRPTGHARARNVAEMFAEARIPSWQRLYWPMVMSGEKIVWTRRFGAAAEFTADKEAARVLRISEVLRKDEVRL